MRSSHGTVGAERKKITLVRKSTSEIKQADASGKARTIQVEVRKKRIFVKRDDVAPGMDEAAAAAAAEAEQAELARREDEAQAAGRTDPHRRKPSSPSVVACAKNKNVPSVRPRSPGHENRPLRRKPRPPLLP